MDTGFIYVSDILVAGVTIRLRRVSDQARVGNFLIFSMTITTVTDNTAYLTVSILNEIGIFEEDLLPDLQRR